MVNLPEMPDEDHDFTPELVRKIIALYQQHIAALKKENERLSGLADGYGKLDADYAIAERRIAALEAQLAARTGAVKVKALEWQEDANGCLYAQTELGEYVAWPNGRVQRGVLGASKVDGGIIGAKAAAQTDYERRILAAIELAEPATDVEPTRKVIYEALRFANWAAGQGISPAEGEPVSAPEDFLMEYSNATDDEDWEGLANRIYTRPAEQAVTEAMIEAAANAIYHSKPRNRPWEMLRPEYQRQYQKKAAAALKAAMEAGR